MGMSGEGDNGRPAQIGRLRVALVSTAPAGALGSMTRYAGLVEKALAAPGGAFACESRRIELAAPEAVLRRIPRFARNAFHHGVVWWRARNALGAGDADVIHLLDGSHAYALPGLCARVRVGVVTVHDLIPLLTSLGRLPGRPPSRAAGVLLRRSLAGLERARVVAAPSACTRRDLLAHAPVEAGRCVVVRTAIEAAATGGRTGPAPATPYILHVGHNAAYKNREGVVEIFARVCAARHVRLLLAGPPPSAELVARVARLGLADRVEFVASPSDAQLAELYEGAALLLFPSLYEGFGLPPLEAMARGCPVVCSNGGALAEFEGDAALLAAPDDVRALAGHCSRILEDDVLAESLRDAGRRLVQDFELPRMRDELLAAYRMAVEGAG